MDRPQNFVFCCDDFKRPSNIENTAIGIFLNVWGGARQSRPQAVGELDGATYIFQVYGSMHSRIAKNENATFGYEEQSSMNIGPNAPHDRRYYIVSPRHELVRASGLDFDNILLNRDVDLAQTLPIVCHSSTHPKVYWYFTIDAWKIKRGLGDLPLLQTEVGIMEEPGAGDSGHSLSRG